MRISIVYKIRNGNDVIAAYLREYQLKVKETKGGIIIYPHRIGNNHYKIDSCLKIFKLDYLINLKIFKEELIIPFDVEGNKLSKIYRDNEGSYYAVKTRMITAFGKEMRKYEIISDGKSCYFKIINF